MTYFAFPLSTFSLVSSKPFKDLPLSEYLLYRQNDENYVISSIYILLAVSKNVDLRTLTKLALKLAGLYIITTTVVGTLGYFMHPAPEAVLWYAVVYSLYLIFGLWLFWFPGTIINQVIRIKGEEFEGELTGLRILEVGFALLGAYFAVAGSYACVYVLARAKWFYRFTDPFAGAPGPGFSPDDFATIVASAIQILLGVGLWFGRRRLARLNSIVNVDP